MKVLDCLLTVKILQIGNQELRFKKHMALNIVNSYIYYQLLTDFMTIYKNQLSISQLSFHTFLHNQYQFINYLLLSQHSSNAKIMSNQQKNTSIQHSLQQFGRFDDTANVQSSDPNTNSSCDSKTGESQQYSYSSQVFNRANISSGNFNFTKKDQFWVKQKINIKRNGKPYRMIQKKTDRFRLISNISQEQSSDEKIFSNSMDNIGSKKAKIYTFVDQRSNKNISIQENCQKKAIKIPEDLEFDQKSSCKTTVSKLIQSTPLEERILTCQQINKNKEQLFQSFQSLESHHNAQQILQQKEQASETNSSINDNEMFYSLQQKEPQKIQMDHYKQSEFQIEKTTNLETKIQVKHQEEIKRLRQALRESIDQNQLLKDRLIVLQSIIGELTSGAICQIKKNYNDHEKHRLNESIVKRKQTRKYSC